MLLMLLLIPIVGIFILSTGMFDELSATNIKRIKVIALTTSIVNLFVLWIIFILFDITSNQFQFVLEYHEISTFDFYLGIDGLSKHFVLLITVMMPIFLLSNWTSISESVRSDVIFFLLLESLLLTVCLVSYIFLFYIFFLYVIFKLFLLIPFFIQGVPCKMDGMSIPEPIFFWYVIFKLFIQIEFFVQGVPCKMDRMSIPEPKKRLMRCHSLDAKNRDLTFETPTSLVMDLQRWDLLGIFSLVFLDFLLRLNLDNIYKIFKRSALFRVLTFLFWAVLWLANYHFNLDWDILNYSSLITCVLLLIIYCIYISIIYIIARRNINLILFLSMRLMFSFSLLALGWFILFYLFSGLFMPFLLIPCFGHFYYVNMDLFCENIDSSLHINAFTVVNMDSSLNMDGNDRLSPYDAWRLSLTPQMQGAPAPSGGGGENIALVGGSPNDNLQEYLNLSPSPVAQHLQSENPELPQNLVQQPEQNLVQQQVFQNIAQVQNRFSPAGQLNIGEQIVQQAQHAFQHVAQPNIGEQIVQQAQHAFNQPVANIAEVAQVQARDVPVVDLEHVIKSHNAVKYSDQDRMWHPTGFIPDDDLLRSSGVHLLRDNNQPDGRLLGEILSSSRPVSYPYKDYNHFQQHNIDKVAYGPYHNNPNPFLTNPIAVPEQIAHKHEGLGFAMPITKNLHEKIQAGSVVIKVNGEDATIFKPKLKNISRLWIPMKNPPYAAHYIALK